MTLCSTLHSARLRRAVGITLLGATLTFASAHSLAEQSANAYYEEAISLYNQEQYDAAIIQLKNALQQNARLLPALVLLGQAHLKAGNYATAETTLRDANELGADNSLTAIPLAKAYMAQFKHDLLLAQTLPKLPTKILSELLVLRAQAALEVGNDKAFLDALTEAETIAPDAAELLSLKVTRAMQLGELGEADKVVQRILDLYPSDANSWIAQASLKQIVGDLEGALKDYDLALSIDPERSDARIAKVSLLLDLNRDDETTAELKKLSETRSSDPRVSYLRSIKLARSGDEHGSREALNHTLNVLGVMGPEIVDRNQQLVLISAIANLNLGSKDLALVGFEKYVKMGGNEPSAKQSLAQLYVERGDFLNATSLLERLLEQTTITPELLTLLTEAYHGSGQHQKAINLLEYVERRTKDSPQLDARLAISRLQAGYIDRGMQDLENLFRNKNTQQVVGMPLALMHLNRGKYEQAYEVVAKLRAEEPDNLTYLSLMAVTEVSRGKLEEARRLFNTLSSDPAARFTAEINLAKIDAIEQNFTAAKNRLDKLLQQDKKNSQVLLELSRVSLQAGEWREAMKWATEASSVQPDSFKIKRHIIELLMQNKEWDEANKLAAEQAHLYKNNLYVLETQLKVLMAQKEKNQALGLLSEMTGLANFNADWLQRVANYQIALDAPDQASYTLFKALQGNPLHLESRALLTEVLLQLQRLDEAQENSAFLIKNFPTAPQGYALRGDINMQQGAFVKAQSDYKKALNIEPQPGLILRLHLAHKRAKQADQAKAILAGWLLQHPQDFVILNALAELEISQRNYEAARQHYEQLLLLQPNNPYLHNNMANTLLLVDQREQALQVAQKAHTLAPENPSINDTLGWLLIHQGETERGLSYLREALTRAADNPEIRYHLAVALHRLGRDQEARLELKRILQKNQPFMGRPDAEALMAKIGG